MSSAEEQAAHQRPAIRALEFNRPEDAAEILSRTPDEPGYLPGTGPIGSLLNIVIATASKVSPTDPEALEKFAADLEILSRCARDLDRRTR